MAFLFFRRSVLQVEDSSPSVGDRLFEDFDGGRHVVSGNLGELLEEEVESGRRDFGAFRFPVFDVGGDGVREFRGCFPHLLDFLFDSVFFLFDDT